MLAHRVTAKSNACSHYICNVIYLLWVLSLPTSSPVVNEAMECYYRMAYSVLKTGPHCADAALPHPSFSCVIFSEDEWKSGALWTMNDICSNIEWPENYPAASPSQVPTNKDLRIFSSSVISRKTKHIDDRSLWLIFCSIEIIFQFLAFPCTVWIDSNNAAVIFFKLRLRIRKVSPHLVWLRSWCIHSSGTAGCRCRLELETNRSLKLYYHEEGHY